MITRNMREAVCSIATGLPVRHSEGVLRECVSAGLLVLEFGEYTPTKWGFEVSNEVAADRYAEQVYTRGFRRSAA